MVKIASKDFNKELSGYIGRRKTGKGLFSKVSIKISKKEKKPAAKSAAPASGVQVEYKQPGFFSRMFSFRRGLIKEAERSEDLSPEEMAKLRGMEDDIEDTEREIAEKEEEVREIRQEEEVLVEKREGLLSKMFSKLKLKRRVMAPEPEDEPLANAVDEPVIAEDVVEAIKIATKWLNELTPGKKRSFKASADFQKYKEVLDKYGLTRQKK